MNYAALQNRIRQFFWDVKEIQFTISFCPPTQFCHEPWRKNVESRKRICHNMLLLTQSNVMFYTKLDMWEELFNFCGMKKVKKDWQFSKKYLLKTKLIFHVMKSSVIHCLLFYSTKYLFFLQYMFCLELFFASFHGN